MKWSNVAAAASIQRTPPHPPYLNIIILQHEAEGETEI